MNSNFNPIVRLGQDLPGIFAYPARRDVLGAIAAYALLRVFTYFLCSAITIRWLPHFVIFGDVPGIPPFLVGMLVELIVWLLVMKLAVETLLAAANDRLDPSKASGKSASDDQAGGQLIVLALFSGTIYYATLKLGALAGWMLLLVAGMVLPAAIILLVVDQNLWQALNPFAWRRLMVRVGGIYGAVAALVGLLPVLIIATQLALFSRLPDWLDAFAIRFVSLYALAVAYCLMGRLLYLRHEILGLDITPPIVRPVLASAAEDQAIQQAETLAAEHRPVEAADCLQELIRRSGASAPVHERYRKLLLIAKDIPRLSQHGREYVSTLLALGEQKRALAIAAESLARDPDFHLDRPEEITQLVEYAAATGQSKTAIHLAAGFDARFPKSPDIARNILIAATLMAEKLGNEKEAKQLLDRLLRTHPEDPLVPEIQAALARVEGAMSVGRRDHPCT